MSYSKKEIYQFTNKLYKQIREHSKDIRFEKLYSNTVGSYDSKTKQIIVDYRRDILSTLIHEVLHHWHPDWCETKVLQHESLIINSLSQRQIKNIIRVIGQNI